MELFTNEDKHKLVEFYEYFESLKSGNQRRKLNEENQELTEELLLFDAGIGNIEDIIKELADNLIVIFEHIYALDIEEEELKEAIKEKILRTDYRKTIKYYEKL